jgi:PTH1 family peptidyl-tRNA hydrolase
MKTSNLKIKAILGLGNPAQEYQDTYHNVGANLIDFLASDLTFKKPFQKHFEYAQLFLSNIRINPLNQHESASGLILIRPLVFMNQSGRVVRETVSYFKLKPEEIAVAHDDSDMTLGNYKISFDQRSAGHKGVQSVVDILKTQKFWRIKIGIRPPQEKVRKKSEEFVLKKINQYSKKIIGELFERIYQEIFSV